MQSDWKGPYSRRLARQASERGRRMAKRRWALERQRRDRLAKLTAEQFPAGIVRRIVVIDHERIAEIIAPWKVASYATTERPILAKPQMLEWLRREGIRPPRLYEMGFPHNNCGGFCIKAGQAHFAHLLRMMPDRYRYHEGKEEEMRQRVGDYSILRDRTGGTTKTLTLRQLRERIESQGEFDAFEWGGCGCALPQ